MHKMMQAKDFTHTHHTLLLLEWIGDDSNNKEPKASRQHQKATQNKNKMGIELHFQSNLSFFFFQNSLYL